MTWRDRLRRTRRAADPYTPAVRSPGAAGERPGPAVQASTVPGDWDGGWRRTAPPQLTVARTPMAVSDGLAFRAGLAAWRDPSFDTGLAHGLLASAPGGLMHEVVRPAASAPASHSGGGPLLLRALPPAGEEALPGAGEGGSPPPGVRHGGAAPAAGRRSPAARSGGATRDTTPSGAGSAVAPAPPGEHPRQDLAPVRRRAPDSGRASDGRGTSQKSAAPQPHTPPPSRRPQARRRARADAGPPDSTVSGTGDGRSTPGPVGEQRTTPPVQRRARSGTRSPDPATSPASPDGGSTANGPRSATGGPSPSGPPSTGAGRPPADRSGHAAPSAASARARGQRGPAFEHTATVLGTAGPATHTAPVQRTGPPGSPAGPAPSPPRFPLVRRVAVVPDSPAPPAPVGRGPGTAPPGTGMKAAGASAVRRGPGPVPSVPDGPETGRPSVRPRPVGRSLTVARRTAAPVRRVSVVRPAAPAADARSGSADAAATGPVRSARSGTGAPVPRASGRPPLGAPLPGPLPPTATEPHRQGSATGSAPGPALPVVQNRAEEPAVRRQTRPEGGGRGTPTTPSVPGSAHRSAPQQPKSRRTGLGPPLAALPPSAGPPVPDSRTARASGPDARTAVQRTPAGSMPAAPAPAGAPPAQAPSTGAQAPPTGHPRQVPLLGPPPEPHTGKADGTPGAGATGAPGTPGVPGTLVRRRAAQDTEQPDRAPAPQDTGLGVLGATRHDRPVHVVVARAVAGPEAVAAPGSQAAPPARPTVRLLAARPLVTGTGKEDAIAPPPAPARSRPVVAASWSRDAAVAGSGGAPAGGSRLPAGAPPVPVVQRAPAAAAPPRVVRPAPAARPRVAPEARPDGSAPARPLPMAGPQPRLPTVQPSATAPPKPADALRAAPAASPTAQVVQRVPDPPARSGQTGGAASTTPPPQGLKSAPQGAQGAGSHGKAAQVAAGDLDDLARRLLDPVTRLLRAELRRGRERTGRPFDGRR